MNGLNYIYIIVIVSLESQKFMMDHVCVITKKYSSEKKTIVMRLYFDLNKKRAKTKLAPIMILLLFIGYGNNINAQNKTLTLEDIYTNNLYSQKGIGPLRWMKDNK